MSRLNFVPIRSDPRTIFLSGNRPISRLGRFQQRPFVGKFVRSNFAQNVEPFQIVKDPMFLYVLLTALLTQWQRFLLSQTQTGAEVFVITQTEALIIPHIVREPDSIIVLYPARTGFNNCFIILSKTQAANNGTA